MTNHPCDPNDLKRNTSIIHKGFIQCTISTGKIYVPYVRIYDDVQFAFAAIGWGLIVIVMVYWFKLVALIYPPAPAQSLTVTPSVVEWVKFSRNLQQITLLRPRTLHCTAAACWLVCESMHHQFTNVHTVRRRVFFIHICLQSWLKQKVWLMSFAMK